MNLTRQELQTLREAVKKAASHGPRDFMTEGGRLGFDQRLWKVLTEQIGLASLAMPEESGGAGGGIRELAEVLEELAGELAVVPALTSMGMATVVLRLASTPEAEELLSRMAQGTTMASVAWPDLGSIGVEPTVMAADGGRTATGRCSVVLGSGQETLLLVPASLAGGSLLLAIDVLDPAVRRVALPTLDLTRGAFSIELDAAPATVVATNFDLGPALDISLVLAAAEQVGIAQHCHHFAVAWAKERMQFDRPIGQFQAIKHLLVNLYLDLELGRSSLDLAVDAVDAYLVEPSQSTRAALAIAASAAKARCSDAAMHVADEALHILGGIGFTWEHDAHLYFRRAKALELLFGSPGTHRERFAKALLDDAARGGEQRPAAARGVEPGTNAVAE